MTDEGQSGAAETAAGQAEVKRYFWRNYMAHGFDGGFFRGAAIVTSATIVLPPIIKDLGGPAWLITMVPVMMSVGFTAPAVFTAHWIDRQARYMPLLLVTGAFQRLPYLVAGLILLLAPTAHPTVLLAAVALAPLVSGISGGITMTAWQQLVVRTIPENRRSSLFGFRFTLASILGLTGGWVVHASLDAYPGPVGYGVLHLYSFTALAISYIAFAMIRETNTVPVVSHGGHTLGDNLRAIPSLLRSAPHMVYYIATVALNNGMFILIPYLSIRAKETLHMPPSYLGELVAAQMVGAILGNFVAGYLGDRYGGKRVMMIGQALFVPMAIWSYMAGTGPEFLAIFVLFGFAQNMLQIAGTTLNMEICPANRRSTYLAMILFIGTPSTLAAAVLSAQAGDAADRYIYIMVMTVVCLVAALAFLWRVQEPRKTPAVPLEAEA
jgi:MFS family permease